MGTRGAFESVFENYPAICCWRDGLVDKAWSLANPPSGLGQPTQRRPKPVAAATLWARVI